MLSPAFIAWVASLPITTELSVDRQLVWCDEHHYWHASPQDCDYSPQGAHNGLA
jgi:hypothetical protein